MTSIIKFLLLSLMITPALASEFSESLVISDEGFVQTSAGLSDDYTSKTGGDWYFSFSAQEFYERVDLRVYFPRTATLKAVDTNLDYTIGYENALFIEFEKDNIIPRIIVKYSLQPPAQTNYFLVLLLSFIPVIIIISCLILRIKKTSDKVLSLLNEKERQVYLTVRQENGVKQSKLRKVTGLPKATLSRTIDSLERKGLIRKQGYGMTNRISLK